MWKIRIIIGVLRREREREPQLSGSSWNKIYKCINY